MGHSRGLSERYSQPSGYYLQDLKRWQFNKWIKVSEAESSLNLLDSLFIGLPPQWYTECVCVCVCVCVCIKYMYMYTYTWFTIRKKKKHHIWRCSEQNPKYSKSVSMNAHLFCGTYTSQEGWQCLLCGPLVGWVGLRVPTLPPKVTERELPFSGDQTTH